MGILLVVVEVNRKNRGGRHRPLNTLTAESSNSDSDSNENAIFSIMNDTSDSTVYKNMKATVNDIPMSRSVVENNFTTVSEPESIANESPIVQVVNSLSQFKVELNVETSHPVQFLIDSGSALNILTFDTFNKINNTNGNLTLRKSTTTVLTYGQDQPSLKILGVTTCMIESKQKILCAEFHVIDTRHRNLLSGNLALERNLISMKQESNN